MATIKLTNSVKIHQDSLDITSVGANALHMYLNPANILGSNLNAKEMTAPANSICVVTHDAWETNWTAAIKVDNVLIGYMGGPYNNLIAFPVKKSSVIKIDSVYGQIRFFGFK